MPNEQLIELTFPLKGMDVTTEFALQPADTTPLAVNVRSIDPVEHRNRGASRSGIRKYVDQKLGIHSLIQHLNIIVDPTIDASLDDVDAEKWFNDGDDSTSRLARRQNRYIRRGGGGVMMKRQRPNPPVAVNDAISTSYGAAPTTIQPLDNDTYSGAATFAVATGSRLYGGSYSIAGPIGGWDFTWTPSAERRGPLVTTLRYSLSAAGNRGKAYAKIIITHSERLVDTYGPYGAQTMAMRSNSDFPFGIGRFSADGVTTNVIFVADDDPGPFNVPGFTGYYVAMPDDGTFDTFLAAMNVIVPGTLSTGPPGSVVVLQSDPGTGPAGPDVRDFFDFDYTPP